MQTSNEASKRSRTDAAAEGKKSGSDLLNDGALKELARKTAKELMSSNDASHDYSHAFRLHLVGFARIRKVAATASTLSKAEVARGESVDELVVTLAATLHDVADHKYVGPAEAAATLERALDALRNGGLEDDRVAKVKLVIENMSFSKEIDTASKAVDLSSVAAEIAVVMDADKLDAMGAVGIARTFTFGGAKKRPLYDPDVPLMTEVVDLSAEEYAASAAKGSPTYDHFFEKLLKLKDMMKTQAGRAAAEVRHQMRMEIAGEA